MNKYAAILDTKFLSIFSPNVNIRIQYKACLLKINENDEVAICLFFSYLECLIYESLSEKKYLLTCASNEDSNQPAHPRSLIRAFVVRMKKPCIPGFPKCDQWRFWSDCANAQADLNLRWAHMSEGTFSDVTTYIIYLFFFFFFFSYYYYLSVSELFYFVCLKCNNCLVNSAQQGYKHYNDCGICQTKNTITCAKERKMT